MLSRLLATIATSCLFLAAPALATIYTNWPIGVEREVDEGYYMRVVAVENGWRVWRIETASDIHCRAIKSGIGFPHPYPVGVTVSMTGADPYLTAFARSDGTIEYFWSGQHFGRISVKLRATGERFWAEHRGSRVDMTPYEERQFEVLVESWEYPEILVGLAQDRARFNGTGIVRAAELVRACDAAG